MRLTFVTDIITPYTAVVFEELAKLAALRVIYCSETASRGMPWDIRSRLSFQHEVIGGLTMESHVGGVDYHMSPRILAAIARSRPEVIVTAGYSFPTMYATLYSEAARCSVVIFSEGTARSERRLGRPQGISRAVLLRRARCCVANSEPAAQRFRDLGVQRDRIFMARHTTNLEPMWRVGQARQYRVGGPLRIVAVGRLIALKGLDRLLRATAAAVEAGAQIEVRLVGNGPEESRLRELAAELGIGHAVTFLGFLDHAALADALADADAFAFTTLRDGYGIALLEAAAAGLPLVASPHAGGTHDLVREGQNGLVVDPDDLGALKDALVRLWRDPALGERFGRAAREESLHRTPEAAAKAYSEAAAVALRRDGRAIG